MAQADAVSDSRHGVAAKRPPRLRPSMAAPSLRNQLQAASVMPMMLLQIN